MRELSVEIMAHRSPGFDVFLESRLFNRNLIRRGQSDQSPMAYFARPLQSTCRCAEGDDTLSECRPCRKFKDDIIR